MNQAAVRALLELLPRIFSPEELRQWIPDLPDGDRITAILPGGIVGPAQLFFAAVDTFKRYGLLGLPEFWDPLERSAPMAHKAGVRELRARFGVPSGQSPAPREASAFPAVITVMLVSASPESADRIRVDSEFRDIIDKVQGTPARGRIRFEQINAARFGDLRAALLRHEPHVLHISSHGEPDGSLLLEASDASGSHRISKRRLVDLFTELNDNLRLVIVNACHSEALVREIPPAIDLTIGMNTAVADQAARDFAASFYETLGYGKSVEKAFKVALASVEDGDEDVPQLFPTRDDDTGKKRQLVLIAP
jgi:hypothetical protein